MFAGAVFIYELDHFFVASLKTQCTMPPLSDTRGPQLITIKRPPP
jgi:transcriptional regulator of acetoin/glycerol metabolism